MRSLLIAIGFLGYRFRLSESVLVHLADRTSTVRRRDLRYRLRCRISSRPRHNSVLDERPSGNTGDGCSPTPNWIGKRKFDQRTQRYGRA